MPLFKKFSLDQLALARGLRRKPQAGSAAQPGPASVLSKIDQELNGVLGSNVIPGLDAVRALAITLVLIEHFRVFDHVFHTHPYSGSMGVMIFFVLSGFLITWMLLKEHRRTGTISLRNFYRRRAFRIFPSFYVCWILTTLVESVAHKFEWAPALVSFFYFMDYGRGLHPVWMDTYRHMWISWSLAVEEKFYLFWPLLLLFLLKNRATLIRNLCLIIGGQWVYRAILYLVFHITWDHVYCTFDMRADALLIGCLAAILVEDEPTRLLCCRLLHWQWLSIFPALALAVGMLTISPDSNRYLLLSFWTIQPVIIAMMLLQFVYWGSKSWTICSNPVVRFTAQISYALYLYHPLGGEIADLSHMPHVGYSAVAITVVLTLGSYYLIERPFMRMRDKGKRPLPKPISAEMAAP